MVSCEREQILGLKQSKLLHCSIVVFVCWTFVVGTTRANESDRLDLDLYEQWYQRRADWQARPAYSTDLLELPVPFVVIGHTATSFCADKFSCIREVSQIQADHQNRGWYDIGPNFLVGGNGYVFEGRRANILGALIRFWNRNIITFMFLGNFSVDFPTQEQFDNVNVLLKELVKKDVLSPDYTLVGYCQLVNQTVAPGPHLMDNLHNFKHWDADNSTNCLRLE